MQISIGSPLAHIRELWEEKDQCADHQPYFFPFEELVRAWRVDRDTVLFKETAELGLAPLERADRESVTSWDLVLDVALKGTFYVCRSAARLLRRKDADYGTQPGKLFRLMSPARQRAILENNRRAAADLQNQLL